MLGMLSLSLKRLTWRQPMLMILLTTILFFSGSLLSQAMAAEIFTDKEEYLPGETAVIAGSTFRDQELVTLQVTQLDGSALSGEGGLPWDISADNLGDFETYWSVEWEYAGQTLLVTAVGQESGGIATATFVAPSSNLDQLQNGTTTTPPAWSNGNINSSNSCYSEGSSVPYRFFITGLDGGTAHYFTIQMEWTKGAVHAIDYLTDYDATDDSAITLVGGPCGTIATSPPPGCSPPTASFPFPDFLNTANYSGTIPPDFFTTVNPGFVLDGPRNLMAYNCTIDSIGKYVFNGTASDRTLDFIVYFTVDTTGSVGLFWGGHLAEGNADAWGYGMGSASVSGAPYHMRALSLDGGGGANQDRSIQNGVICEPPNVGIVCSTDSVCNTNGATYSCRDTSSTSNIWSWTVINGTIVGPDNLDSVVYTVDYGLQPGEFIYIYVESCDSSSGCPGTFCCAIDSVMIPVGDCNDPPEVVCPNDASIFLCDSGQVCVHGFSYSDPNDNIVSVTVTPGTLDGDSVCFAPVEGVNEIILTVTDYYGLTAVCTTSVTVTFNDPPVAYCPGDTSVNFLCEPSEICYGSGFTATDPDNNIVSETVSLGTLIDGAVCFTPDTAGVYSIIYTVTDACDEVDACTSLVTVSFVNQPPVATCPGDQTLFVCDLSPITLSGFGCTDSDANLASCEATGGTLSGDQVTFTPVPGVNTITLTATDDCGATDVCQTNITVILNSPPVAACPDDFAHNFLCEPSEICFGSGFTATDPDNNIVSETVSLGTLSGGAVCFTPDTAGIYTVIYTVTDACGAADICSSHVTVSFVNQPPVATCPGDQTLFVCNLSPITIDGFSCSDPDGNLVSCVATGGTLIGTAVTFTPVVGDNFLTLTATDDCGATDVCQTKITVSLNSAPAATCPGNVSLFVCDLSDITIGGFGCSDPDNNLASCDVSLGTLVGDEVTFTPAPGVNTITLTATDACGATSSCQTQVTVILNQMPYFTAPDDDLLFLCATEELCYTLDFGDPDVGLGYQSEPTAYLLDGPGSITDHELCFTPIEGVDTTYWFKIQVCDSCGTPSNPAPPSPPNSCVIDSFSVTITFNQAPVANCPPPLDTFLCVLGPITISGFECSDPDDNLASCETVPGPLTGGSVTFTPVEGTNYIILTATDECGWVDVCTTVVTVTLNSDPVAECLANATYTLCNLEQICVSGFICSDPDDNLVSCEVVDHTLNNGEVCFMPVEGINDLMLVATDACGMIDTCHTYITVNLLSGPTIPDKTVAGTLCVPGDICTELPPIAGGTPPFTWTLDGRPVTDTVCVYFADDGSVAGQVIVTDSCGRADTATLTINATVNTAPSIIIEEQQPIFLCTPDSISIPLDIFDPDNTLTGLSKIGVVDLTDSTVTFYAGTTGRYCDTVIISDSCDLADTAYYCVDVTINTPPQCPPMSDISEFQCVPTRICQPVNATDADANLTGCTVVEGPGAIIGGEWCYTPTGDITATVTIRCTDDCNIYCETSFNLNVDINAGPIAECPDNSFKNMTTLHEICIPGFSCSDPDDNLTDCRAEHNGVPVPLVGDEVCFTPVWGDNWIALIAMDECGKADTCMTNIMVIELTICPVVMIEKTHGTLQGHYEEVSVVFQNDPDGSIPEMGGFDFLIAYDASALAFMEAIPGQLLEDCGWEYFTYRFGVDGNCGDACPSGLIRIIGIAETNNGPNHPNCYGPPDTDPYELFRLVFFVTNDRTYECQYVPITFFWADCSDNAISSINGDSLILDSKIFDFEGNLIWDEGDDDLFPESARIPFIGAPDYCLEGDKVTPFRCLELYEGGIDIICSDSIDARGDINVNGVANEVADAVMLTNYFISGLSAFGNHVEASISASDVNADGIALSVADLVYLVRIITGDALPYAKPILTDNFSITTTMADNQLSVTYDASARAGAVLLTFNIEGVIDRPVLGDGAQGMDIEYGIDGQELRILVYDIGTNAIASGQHELLSIPVDGSLTLIGAEASDYFGNSLNVLTRTIPGKFTLSQNRPNPFNPLTTISLSMPIAGEWNITVYNISGQVVREYSGYDQAGTVQVTWDGTDSFGQKVASGIYLYRAAAGPYSETRKMVLMK